MFQKMLKVFKKILTVTKLKVYKLNITYALVVNCVKIYVQDFCPYSRRKR